MKIYYKIVDRKITSFYPVLEENEADEDEILEQLGSECDDRQNYGCFTGFENKSLWFIEAICHAALTKIDPILNPKGDTDGTKEE